MTKIESAPTFNFIKKIFLVSADKKEKTELKFTSRTNTIKRRLF